MKLGDGVEAAIHCTAMLAGLQGSAVLPAAALAHHHGVSASYLVKHLKTLVAAGILHSHPGPAGGYRLGRPADQITLLDIVLAVEGPEPAFRCTEIRRRGDNPPDATAFAKPCGINAAMLRAERAYRAALSEVRLSDLIDSHMTGDDPRTIARNCAFIDLNQRLKS